MTHFVSLYEAKTQLSALVERAAAGEEIVIAKKARRRRGWFRSNRQGNAAGQPTPCVSAMWHPTSTPRIRASNGCSVVTTGEPVA